mgnify:CR=1 FL=1
MGKHLSEVRNQVLPQQPKVTTILAAARHEAPLWITNRYRYESAPLYEDLHYCCCVPLPKGNAHFGFGV